MDNRQLNTVINAEKRQDIIRMVIREGLSHYETARMLGVSRSVVQKIVSRYVESSSAEAGQRGGPRRVVITEIIKNRIIELMNDNNIYNLGEIKSILDVEVTISTIWKWVKDLGITYKLVRPVYERRNDPNTKILRQEYARWYNTIRPTYRIRNLIYVDESPFSLHIMRSHGWAPRGTTPNPIVAQRGRNITMILAINGLNIINCEAVLGNVNGQTFKGFINTTIAALGNQEKFTFVMDNVRFHHQVNLLDDNSPHDIKFLPPYSPMLNPCEEVFSWIKSQVRRSTPPRGADDLIERMRVTSMGVTQTILEGYINHSESFFEKCLILEDIPRE